MSQNRPFLRHPMAKWGLFMVALVALWFGAWLTFAWWLDGKLGEATTRLAKRGITIDCADRSVVGFPFRGGIACSDLSIDDRIHDFQLTSGPLRSAAQLYDPFKSVVEFDGPLMFSRLGFDLRADWQHMRLFFEAARGGFERTSLTYRQLDGDIQGRSFAATKGALHVRPTPQAAVDLDIAGTVDLVQFASTGFDPVNVAIDARLKDGYRDFIISRRAPVSWLRDGGNTTFRNLALTLPDGGVVAAMGDLLVNPDGTLSGEMKIGAQDIEKVAQWVAEINPEFGPMVAALGQGIAMLGKSHTIAGREMEAITVTIVGGEARVDFIQLGRIPPIPLQ